MQVFISFIFKNFLSAIFELQSLILSWMSSNYLTLNQPKSEFILIGVLQQTFKIINPCISLPAVQSILPNPPLKMFASS